MTLEEEHAAAREFIAQMPEAELHRIRIIVRDSALTNLELTRQLGLPRAVVDRIAGGVRRGLKKRAKQARKWQATVP